MSEKSTLVWCTCYKCQETNENGTYVSKSARTRHHKKHKEHLDFLNKKNKKQKIESIQIDDNDKAIQFDDNEEVIQFDNNEVIQFVTDSDSDNNQSSSESLLTFNSETESNSSLENFDNNISNEIATSLRLFEIKIKHNITDAAFKEIIIAANGTYISSFILKNILQNIVSFEPIWIDMCIKTCCAFTGEYNTLDICPYCKSERYYMNKSEKKSRAQFMHFSLKDRFKIQYQDPERALQLQYQSKYVKKNEYNTNTISDVFDSNHYKYLVQKGYFQDDHDIALLGSVDGYQIFKQKCDDCWVILFINANLPPEQHVKKNNLLVTSIIPGPNAPKNFNSFMTPIIEELHILEGNYFYYLIFLINF